ncbi:DUF2752 domain-containing protein [Aquimarina sp. MMG016]|nr:DUF2752 domain-containing protein [Aquimarina sp. MMG016]
MLPCLNKKLFGVDCLGCGMQRSAALILKGEFVAAFYMYPAIYPLLFLLIFIGFNFFVSFKHDWTIKLALMIITVLTIIISYFIKMKIFF